MGDKSGIGWTDATWNPVVGCKLVSEGCDHCYAASLASGRLAHTSTYAGLAKDGLFTGEVRCLPERLDQPLRWKRPRRIFVNSMSDLFHPDIPGEFQEQIFDVMREAHWHQFQVLTKRPQIMAKWVSEHYPFDAPANVWLGTSIELDKYVFRANHVRATPAAVRFLSLEPLLGPLPSLDLTDIDWVIVGGESGRGARPMYQQWVRDLRDQCSEFGVAFFFKQWGAWVDAEQMPESTWKDVDAAGGYPDGLFNVGAKKAGNLLDGETYEAYPDVESSYFRDS